MTNPFRLGTGGSPLALGRARSLAGRLGAELVPIGAADAASGGSVDALRAALRAGDVDAIVHPYEALPVEPAEGLVVAAVAKRGDARDALAAAARLSLDALPAGARVGVDSALRRAQLLSRRPEVDAVRLQAGREAALAQLAAGELDALLCPAVELEWMGEPRPPAEPLELGGWPTAPAQGAIAIETLAAHAKRVAKIEHRPTRMATDAERAVVARLAIADALIAANALLDDGLLFLSARIYSADGARTLTAAHALYPEDSRDPAGELAERVVDELLANGARDLGASGGDSA